MTKLEYKVFAAVLAACDGDVFEAQAAMAAVCSRLDLEADYVIGGIFPTLPAGGMSEAETEQWVDSVFLNLETA